MKSVRVLVTAAVALLVVGCGSEQAATLPAPIVGPVSCTETPATPAASRPPALAATSGAWYGSDDLWVGLPNYAATVQNGGLVLKFPWVTLDGDAPSADRGTPQVSAMRTDSPTPVQASWGDVAQSFGTSGLIFWPATMEFPAPGCWIVTGRLDATTVQFIVDVKGP
jgi:hypothetical protein